MRNPMAGKSGPVCQFSLLVVLAILSCTALPAASNSVKATAPGPLPAAPYRYYHFNIQYANVTVNCRTKPIVTVNGEYPGPTIYANEGDRMIVNVTNSADTNMTIHFHGIRQVQSPWMDGVAYITQCPIQAGDYYVHDFVIPNQRGTLLWHAHINWQRATVHGAFITYPTLPYPFQTPYQEVPMIIGEWWYNDVAVVEQTALAAATIFNNSDAMTINGHPGPTYNCSEAETYTIIDAIPGQTYLLRIINAALNTQLYFSVANHVLTVVEADGEYLSPFETPIIFVGPGQTTNVLLTANLDVGGIYYISVAGYGRDNIPLVRPAAVFQYPNTNASDFAIAPTFPGINDTGVVLSFTSALRTLYPGRVPLTVDRNLFFAVGLVDSPCVNPLLNPVSANCTGDGRIRGGINNVSFVLPTTTSILQASYYNITGVFTEDFPDNPPVFFDFTGPFSPPPALRVAQSATRILPINFNDTVQLILQDTMVLGFENHPFHLHGHNFYVLAQGFGDYNATIDPISFNLYDPPLRNTVGVPFRGWVAIRLKANNPGLWLFHCHLDKHTSWGMETVFHVHNGIGPNNSYHDPPARLVAC